MRREQAENIRAGLEVELGQGTGFVCLPYDTHPKVTVAGLTVSLHRWLYEQLIGPIRKPYLRPSCGTEGCVHPKHMIQSNRTREPTPKKPRQKSGGPTAAERNRAKTKCPHGHQYTPENTYTWTDSKGREHRTCRRCKIIRINRRKP